MLILPNTVFVLTYTESVSWDETEYSRIPALVNMGYTIHVMIHTTFTQERYACVYGNWDSRDSLNV